MISFSLGMHASPVKTGSFIFSSDPYPASVGWGCFNHNFLLKEGICMLNCIVFIVGIAAGFVVGFLIGACLEKEKK